MDEAQMMLHVMWAALRLYHLFKNPSEMKVRLETQKFHVKQKILQTYCRNNWFVHVCTSRVKYASNTD